MRAHVLTDARLVEHAGRFVWLAIDTERPANAAFLERFPIEVWPTFLVVDPRSEQVVLRWVGSASAARLGDFLADAERARAARPRRPRLDELANEAYLDGRPAECAAIVRDGAPRLRRGGVFASAAGTGLYCALSLDEDAPERPALLAALEPLAREAVSLEGVLADDRSGLYEALHGAREAAGDAAGARAVATRWWRFLERESARAASPEKRAFLDSARISAAVALGDPARAIPPIERSARELPGDYNPPARLARLYLEVGRLDEALAAAERALALAYGPRKLRIHELRATILEARGAQEELVAALDEAVAEGRALPPSQVRGREAVALERMAKRLEELRGPATGG
jgi:tetratricopeptide (TPR) repeat protein